MYFILEISSVFLRSKIFIPTKNNSFWSSSVQCWRCVILFYFILVIDFQMILSLLFIFFYAVWSVKQVFFFGPQIKKCWFACLEDRSKDKNHRWLRPRNRRLKIIEIDKCADFRFSKVWWYEISYVKTNH